MIAVKIIFYKKLMQEEFLQILRTLKQNVFIMTSGQENNRCAVTVSSVTSLSLEPPLIIVCINKNASMHKLLKNYDVYKILPFSRDLMKIDPERPEHNYFNYSNIVFIKKK